MKRVYDNKEEIQNLCSKVTLVERNTSPGGIALVNANKVAKKDHNDIVQLAMEIQKADSFVHATACNKLQVLAQQAKFLQEQAKRILLEAKVNTELHHAACNFVKVAGETYHLYKRPTGQLYFGMLSPEEWNSPHEFIGSFRLEYDQSWTPTMKVSSKDSEMALINKILVAQGPQQLSLIMAETPMEM